MNRRTFLWASMLGALTVPFKAEAEQTGKIPRIAFLTTTSPDDSPGADAFRKGLRDLGYVEDQNISIEWRWGRGTTERFADFAAEVVRLNVDVIVAGNSPAGSAAQRATRAIPIVIVTMNDPVGDGFVASLARPGGNITGLALQTPELQGKRLQLFKDAVPHVSRIALLSDASGRSYDAMVREAEVAARALSMRLQPLVRVRGPNELNDAFATISRENAGAVFVIGGTMLFANRARLAAEALKRHLPMMCDQREGVEAGCLMSYWPSIADLFRRTAGLVDRILKGAKPADLPIEQPTKFELVITRPPRRWG